MASVQTRTVFYLSGFDPKGAAHYHALYRDESTRQRAVGGLPIKVEPRQRLPGGDAQWRLSAQTPSGTVHTRYHFLHWDDVVRAHWPRRSARLWWSVWCTTLFNLRHGALWRMLQWRWPPVLALFAPFMLLLSLLLGLPLVMLGLPWWLAGRGAGIWPGVLATLVATGLVLWLARRLEARFGMAWLMRSYAFNRRQALGEAPDIERRLDEHAATLVAELKAGQADEVLLVGHSSGAMLAVSVLARALRLAPGLASGSPRISLLTLGQCLPMLGCLPQARAFREELREVARAEGVDWLDFTAPPDGCCFALLDPLAACGVAREGVPPDRPKLLSPRFMNMFDAQRYAVLRPDKFRIHFQYLMASEKPVPYDYFAITAGDVRLAERFAAEPGVTHFAGLRLFGLGQPTPS